MRMHYFKKADRAIIEPLFQRLYQEIQELIGSEWFKKNRYAKELALRILTTNLCLCLEDKDGLCELSISRDKNFYRTDSRYKACHFKYGIYIPLVDALVSTGWCIMKKHSFNKETKRGYQTRLFPTSKFIEFVQKDISPFLRYTTEWVYNDCIILRDSEKKDIGYRDNKTTRDYRKRLENLNDFSSKHSYSFEIKEPYLEQEKNRATWLFKVGHLLDLSFSSFSDSQQACVYDPGQAYVESITKPFFCLPFNRTNTSPQFPLEEIGDIEASYFLAAGEPVEQLIHYSVQTAISYEYPERYPINPKLVRIFNVDLEHGGRHYGSFQNLPQIVRRTIQIDGLSTCELDFKALHPTMLYHKLGLNAPEDCYRIIGDDELNKTLRPIIKLALLILINISEKKRHKVKQAIRNNYTLKNENNADGQDLYSLLDSCELTLDDLLDRIEFFHKPIAEFFYSGEGLSLQFWDSLIMSDILEECRRANIPALPIHDSVIVPEYTEKQVRQIMQNAYHDRMGAFIRIEKK